MLRRLLLGILPLIALADPAVAAGPRIAVVAPASGPLAILGEQVRAGARVAARASGAELVEIGEACSEQGDSAIAPAIVSAKAVAAIGFLCTEDLQSVLPALAEAGIPVLTLSARSGVLMEDALKRNWPLFRLAPAPGMEAQKAVDVIAAEWATEPFALIDDGTIHARELVEAVRLKLEERGMKPVFVDTYRPAQEQQIGLVRRLVRAGATRVFVGGDRGDMAIILRDARAERLPLSFMGGEMLMAADAQIKLANGAQAIVLPADGVTPEGIALAAAMKETGIIAEGYVFPAHAAVTVVSRAAAAASAANQPLDVLLRQQTFPTVLGAIGFGENHELRDNPYRRMEWRDGRFQPLGNATAGE
ncbi:branched-chain amino acid transport system substrate-binding protein [Rhizobium azooxidifex]|uniref:Branched-chain amino acid transport system substrate-binding protein n=1 Tax=Mycoplana azooxidifex TaxID=1636188 RepID=A0A7W6D379_9HYPH|nr:ABC transporter substrate-binding protein [Mycoplana azooxidifex]MBB3975039.1 branched-chain amino acid transport system substrate-binding protein [Mycoplana azooxidifex]